MRSGNLNAYSGMSTKLRAMKSQLISTSQYEEISRLPNVAELIKFLQELPSYALVLSDIDASSAHRGAIESRMTFSTYHDFFRIYQFGGKSQKKYLQYFFMQYEVNILKTCLRNILDSRPGLEPILIDDHFRRHSKLDIDNITTTEDIDEFLNYLKDSLYGPCLFKVAEMEKPTLFDYEISLDLFFFDYTWKHKSHFVPKSEQGIYEKLLGYQIDLLNILWIYRCKKYYNTTESQVYSYLINAYYKVKKNEIKKLVECDDDAFFEILKNTFYGRKYGFDTEKPMEMQFGYIVNDIYRKVFKECPYTIASINAYFRLKDIEVQKVVTALECIRYGYSSDQIMKYINEKGGAL